MGVRVSKSTIQRHIEERGSRSSNQTWAMCLRHHASQIWACDFLQTYDIFFCTTFVFVIIKLGSRPIVHLGVTRNPTDQWTTQQLREATAFWRKTAFPDPRQRQQVWRVVRIRRLRCRGAEDTLPHTQGERGLASHAEWERFIGSLRRECLDHFIILDERHLHQIVKEYETYFNTARLHQGIDQRIPRQTERPEPLESPSDNGKLSSQLVLNGLHHIYSWVGAQSARHSQVQHPTHKQQPGLRLPADRADSTCQASSDCPRNWPQVV